MEDILYIGGGETVGESLATAALRLIMAPFAHSLFTTMFAIGVYFALQQRNVIAKAGYILLGYLGAVIMHGLWNGSSLLSIEAYFLIYVFWMVPIFALAIVLGVQSRRREQRIVAAKLPGMVAAGLVTPNEATWLGSIRTRKQAIGAGGAVRRKAGGARRSRTSPPRWSSWRSCGTESTAASATSGCSRCRHEEAYAVHAARSAAPALQWLAGYRAPAPGRKPVDPVRNPLTPHSIHGRGALIDVMPAFLVACVILAALPGPATALFLHRSVRDGRTAGLAAVVGNEIGIFGWTLAGGAGLSVLLMANRALSMALHIVGAAILIWLGISAWRNAKIPADIEVPMAPRGRTPAAAFRAVADLHRRQSESGGVRDRGHPAVPAVQRVR